MIMAVNDSISTVLIAYIFRDSKLVGSLSKYVSVCSNQLDPPVAGAYNLRIADGSQIAFQP